MKKILLLVLAFAGIIIFSACGGQNDAENGNGDKKDISGITFENATFDYDGTEKSVLITGNLPNGVTVSYTGNKATNAG